MVQLEERMCVEERIRVEDRTHVQLHAHNTSIEIYLLCACMHAKVL